VGPLKTSSKTWEVTRLKSAGGCDLAGIKYHQCIECKEMNAAAENEELKK